MTTWKPSQVAVMYCKGHQKETEPVSKENQLGRQSAKETGQQVKLLYKPGTSFQGLTDTRIAPFSTVYQGRRPTGHG